MGHYGTRLFGKVDQVPGAFYVATKFFHVACIPLVPLESALVLEGTEEEGFVTSTYQGFSIPLSGKSVLYAWGRVPLFLAGVGGLFVAGVLFYSARWAPAARTGPWAFVPALAVAVGGFTAFMLTYWLSKASPPRARELAELLEAAVARQAGRAEEESPGSQGWELKQLLRKALALEQRGEWEAAVAQFERVIQAAGDHPNADLARERVRAIREKQQGGGAEEHGLRPGLPPEGNLPPGPRGQAPQA
jgi:hypothetical protein